MRAPAQATTTATTTTTPASPRMTSDLVALHLTPRAARDLGFSEVEGFLMAACKTPFGHEALADDPFPTSLDVLNTRLDEAMEARAAVARKVSPDFGGIKDMRHVVDAAGKGIVLGSNDIVDDVAHVL